MSFKRICVGNKVGALSGFVSNNNDSFLGLSAFHVLSGSNRIIDPFDDIVEILDENSTEWLKLGVTVDGRYYRGDGDEKNFGVLDYAFFKIYNSFEALIRNRLELKPLSPLLFNQNKRDLKGKRVLGFSVIDNSRIIGVISNVYFLSMTNRFDVEIDIVTGYTHEGDSGILWFDEEDFPLCMHIRGNSENYSNKSYSTFLNRIVGESVFYTIGKIPEQLIV